LLLEINPTYLVTYPFRVHFLSPRDSPGDSRYAVAIKAMNVRRSLQSATEMEKL